MDKLDSNTGAEGYPSSAILIGSSAERPLVVIDSLPDHVDLSEVNPLGCGRAHVDRLAPLLQAVPSALAGMEVAGHRYLRVVVDGPLAAAADGNGLRGFTRDVEGNFRSHGRFFEDDRLKNLVASGALFQIASIAVAQKHLADISAKLSEIREGVQRIQEFLEDERRAIIIGRIDYLRNVAPVVMAGEASSSVCNELERCEVDLVAVQKHLELQIGRLADEVAEQKDTSLFGSTGLTDALLEHQKKLESPLEQWQLCMAARLVACQLLGTFREAASMAAKRQKDLEVVIEQFLSRSGPTYRFMQAMERRIGNLAAVTDSRTTIHANRIRLSAWGKHTLPEFEKECSKSFIRIAQVGFEQQRPVTLALKVREGQIMEAFHLPD